ncbi:ABC transporter ATP-binding protein [Corynebacterium flavescens]|uniref:Trehalose import ATP-binding protein SugC n=1 Tax=Corynebacterium flavescens TaxID=28028 RepID=A0A1L7CK78_CORFL|nr:MULTISPECIES: ATP-binding cassette domain-containing protein [Corynebacterium]APT86262.1 sugar ABC transporter ATP-binding protein [Corynebacterium flavescens]KAA8724525.1 ATP-binding cassette domain-containing protein [Corynebacterium flavescens]MDN6099127.1 ATP-binding cassette domain-containing protein [Corynebacterium flavescens]MDN6200237.1 ATP-binding cassette domain-containing protein [Corynebacterium flavescens]MDN6226455.1 ATP-binding cassette domain-containing protein [Corynebacte
MSKVTFEKVSITYPGAASPTVAELDLTISDGEFLVLVGPSGCGKSTTLRSLAGLEPVSSGRILIDDEDVTNLEPGERDIAMVFQNYALYPHLTVAENMGFALRLARLPKAEIKAKVAEAAETLGLSELLDRKPKDLSGGQRQRVAMGRAIVRQPKVFLMDEPLSNLDAKLRVQTRSELASLQQRLGTTTVYVTHDQVEAMTMGDRVAVLKDGILQQVAPPRELYDRPANEFVAGFIGSPSMNIFDFAGHRLGVRPENIRLSAEHGELTGVVDIVEELGAESYVYVTVGSQRFVARAEAGVIPARGEEVGLDFDPEQAHRFDTETGVRLSA